MQEQWQEALEKCYTENPEKFNHIEFLNQYQDNIPGPNRSAKRKRITRYIENYKYYLTHGKSESKTEDKREKYIQEFSMFDAPEIDLNVLPNKTVTFGLISDTHFNSKYCQISYLHEFYDICQDRGITDVYHSGDLDEGESMRPGHAYENYKQGADEHIAEIIKNYPHREGITTHFITGNHDASFRKSCGLDIGTQLTTKRPDFDYLGRDIVSINITDKITMQLRHPWSSSAYALSYRPQKIVESMEASCLDKPTILGIGHFHKMEYLYYHGVHVLQTGCFQSATPFTTGKGISVSMGGWIITLSVDSEGKLKSFIPEAMIFEKAIREDYKNWL